eukprot:CAMPEP_0116990694 /NCGR_PEP_ID=MMETSP0467-20121206/65649_1 /TAXON_ID=283647 /ORGANISM="Mesodinium pulex, Strain SPMC105" /LENGTH=43 /DNA_ID= /DNA_START= /DNA_END= /DNA_ORIENTATION=
METQKMKKELCDTSNSHTNKANKENIDIWRSLNVLGVLNNKHA